MRDPVKPQTYFDSLIAFKEEHTQKTREWLLAGKAPSPNKAVMAAYSIFLKKGHILIMRYSRGDALADLRPYLLSVIADWEQLRDYLQALPESSAKNRAQYENLGFDDYATALWLLSFAVNFSLEPGDMARLIKLIEHEGKDMLLDKIINKLGPSRSTGTKLLYPRPYQPLYDALDTPPEKASEMIDRFLKGWYKGCKRAYWYDNGRDDNSGYFGYWCFEAALVVRLWQIDDTMFADHPHYPRDLVQYGRE